MASKLDYALNYAANGLHVFPLRENGKLPIFEGWESKATTDPEQIKKWWTQRPQSNIGSHQLRKPGCNVNASSHLSDHNKGRFQEG